MSIFHTGSNGGTAEIKYTLGCAACDLRRTGLTKVPMERAKAEHERNNPGHKCKVAVELK